VPDGIVHYVGAELELFQHAVRWKEYWAAQIARWIRGDVLEVGAGLGANTLRLQNPSVRTWLCLEPDPKLAMELGQIVAAAPRIDVSVGTIATIEDRSFDCILYIDVLEHIEDDRTELARAARLLRPNGRLVVLAPALPVLYSRFDQSIGHYRRYTAKTLLACGPPTCQVEASYYLDCVGMLASLGNRMLLRQAQPTLNQILLWDRWIVPASILLDSVFSRVIGKSVLAVWIRRS
jgi:SAM-dependent methyltransferase